MNDDDSGTATYVGQVESDSDGKLWAVLYYRDQVVNREQVRSLRKGKRRISDMVLSAADTFPQGPKRPTPIPLNRILVDQRAPAGRRRRSGVAHVA